MSRQSRQDPTGQLQPPLSHPTSLHHTYRAVPHLSKCGEIVLRSKRIDSGETRSVLAQEISFGAEEAEDYLASSSREKRLNLILMIKKYTVEKCAISMLRGKNYGMF